MIFSCYAYSHKTNLQLNYKDAKEIVIRGIITPGIGQEYIQALQDANKGQIVYLYIKSCGGVVPEGNKIIQAMLQSKAKKIIEIVDYAESLAAILPLFADVVYLRPDVILMYHLPRTNADTIALPTSSNKHFRNIANKVINWMEVKKTIFSNQQWKRFKLGKDVFITGDTFLHRISSAKLAPPMPATQYAPWKIMKCNPDYRMISEE